MKRRYGCYVNLELLLQILKDLEWDDLLREVREKVTSGIVIDSELRQRLVCQLYIDGSVHQDIIGDCFGLSRAQVYNLAHEKGRVVRKSLPDRYQDCLDYYSTAEGRRKVHQIMGIAARDLRFWTRRGGGLGRLRTRTVLSELGFPRASASTLDSWVWCQIMERGILDQDCSRVGVVLRYGLGVADPVKCVRELYRAAPEATVGDVVNAINERCQECGVIVISRGSLQGFMRLNSIKRKKRGSKNPYWLYNSK